MNLDFSNIQSGSSDFTVKGTDIDNITATAGNVLDVGKDIFGTIGSIFGGGRNKCTAQDKQKRQQIAALIRKYLSPKDRRNLVSGMSNRVPPTPEKMAYFFVGEDDCFHKNVDARHQRFLNELPALIQQRKQEQEGSQQAGVMSGGGFTKYLLPVGIGLAVISLGAVVMKDDGPQLIPMSTGKK